MTETKYYDWNRTISYDADVTMVISIRGYGKTYGLRKQCINDYIKRGHRFCNIVRYKNAIQPVASSFFEKVGAEFPGHIFKTEGGKGFIAEKPVDGGKPQWRLLCYFVALSQANLLKQQTFRGVKRFIFDEAIIDKQVSPFDRYLPNEYESLVSVVSSVTRERADDEERVKPKLYLLGNACDFNNPYFAAYGIDRLFDYGYHWFNGHQLLLHFLAPDESYAKNAQEKTLAGRLAATSKQSSITLDNRFVMAAQDVIGRKTSRSRFIYGIIYNGRELGVWTDDRQGLMYINDRIPKDATRIFALTKEDESINRVMAGRASKPLRSLVECYRMGIVRYSSDGVRNLFLDAMKLYGVR